MKKALIKCKHEKKHNKMATNRNKLNIRQKKCLTSYISKKNTYSEYLTGQLK